MTLSRHPPAGRAIPCATLRAANGHTLASVWPGLGVELFESGTAALAVALRLALDSLPAGVRRHVALPAYGCPNLVAATLWAGAEPTYYDISQDTFAAEPKVLDRMLASADRVVVHVDAFGMNTLGASAPERVTLPDRLVHDLAQSFAPYSQSWRPRAHFNVVSFGRAKPVSLTHGGALLTAGDVPIGRIGAAGGELASSTAGYAARAILYSASLRPALFGVLSRVPQLGIGQTRFVPLRNVRRLATAWGGRVASTVAVARQCFDLYVEQTAVILRLVVACRDGLPGAAQRASGSQPLWRVPLLCATAAEANALARDGAHLGVSRLYGKSLPELMGGAPNQARADFPNACDIASRLVTLPTHGRLGARELSELERLLASPPITIQSQVEV